MPSLGRTASSSPPTALFVAASLSEPIFTQLTSGEPRRLKVDKEIGVQRRPVFVQEEVPRQPGRRLQDGQRFIARLSSRDIVCPLRKEDPENSTLDSRPQIFFRVGGLWSDHVRVKTPLGCELGRAKSLSEHHLPAPATWLRLPNSFHKLQTNLEAYLALNVTPSCQCFS